MPYFFNKKRINTIIKRTPPITAPNTMIIILKTSEVKKFKGILHSLIKKPSFMILCIPIISVKNPAHHPNYDGIIMFMTIFSFGSENI